MIIAYDSSFVICTPTKTGTYSLEATLVDGLQIAWKRTPRHRTDYEGDGKRILIVRNPYDRWCSMWWFSHMHASRGNSIWIHDYAYDINVWTTEWARRKIEDPHWMWTHRLKDHEAEFKPELIWKTENLQGLIQHLGYRTRVSHRNKTDYREPVAQTLSRLTPENLKAVLAYCDCDATAYGYPKLELM